MISSVFAVTPMSDQNGQPIPVRYTCDGENQSPPLSWGDPPQGTKSFALVIDDPDAPNGTFRHWGVFDIPASTRSIDGRQRVGTEVTNDFGKAGYGGPCPPKGHGPHHYHLKLFALDVDKPARHFFDHNPVPAPIQAFHERIQREAPHRMRAELVVAAGLLGLSALLVARRRG